MMNWVQIKSNWQQVSEQIKVTWGKLGEEDLAMIAGERDLLCGLLQQRYGYEQAQAETMIDNFTRGLNL